MKSDLNDPTMVIIKNDTVFRFLFLFFFLSYCAEIHHVVHNLRTSDNSRVLFLRIQTNMRPSSLAAVMITACKKSSVQGRLQEKISSKYTARRQRDLWNGTWSFTRGKNVFSRQAAIPAALKHQEQYNQPKRGAHYSCGTTGGCLSIREHLCRYRYSAVRE